MSTKPVSNLTPDHEQYVRDAERSLTKLEQVRDLLRPNTYKATQRDILRTLVRGILAS